MHKYAEKKRITLVAPSSRHVSRTAGIVANACKERFNLDVTNSDPGYGARVLFRWNMLETNFRSAAVYLGSPLEYNERTITDIARNCAGFIVPNRQDAGRVRKLVNVPVFEAQPGVPEEFNPYGRTPNLGRLRVGFVAPFKSRLPGYPDPKGLREIRALANEGEYRWKILDSQNAIEYEQMPDWYRSIDVLVNLSVGEGVPHAVLEALACGCAVIAPEVGVIPELDAGPALIVLKERSVEAIKQALKSISDNRHTLIPSIRESAARLINNGWRWPQRIAAWEAVLQLIEQQAARLPAPQVFGVVTHADLQERKSLAHYTSGFLGVEGWSIGDAPLFSVLMPLYNKRPYLEAAVKSVLAQTYPHWELVVVDDGSTDGSGEEAEKLASLDERIKIVRHESNLGCATATNRAVTESRGVICGILDADDALHADAVARMVEGYKRNPWCGFGWSNFAYCDIETMEPKRIGYGSGIPHDKTQLDIDGTCAFRTFTRFAFDACCGIGKLTNGANDKDMMLRLEEVSPGFFMDSVLYKARQHSGKYTPGSITEQTGDRGRNNFHEVKADAARRRETAYNLSVVIPHAGKPYHLDRVLNAFNCQFSGSEEIIVVDNASVHSSDVKRITAGYGAKYIPVHLGSYTTAQSRNIGVEAAAGKMILFNDSSCLPSPDLIEQCLKADANSVTLFDLEWESEDGGLISHWRTPEFEKLLNGKHVRPWRLTMGAGTLISRWNARRTLFNSGFVGAWGCDDTFFGLQAHASGIPFNVSNKGYVTRLWHESTRAVSPASNRSKYETLRDYYLKVMA